ncbi:MAG: hypothetical protein ABIO94_10540 [Opitutaceae bacterium]
MERRRTANSFAIVSIGRRTVGAFWKGTIYEFTDTAFNVVLDDESDGAVV